MNSNSRIREFENSGKVHKCCLNLRKSHVGSFKFLNTDRFFERADKHKEEISEKKTSNKPKDDILQKSQRRPD